MKKNVLQEENEPRLTIEELRQFPGCEHYTDKQAQDFQKKVILDYAHRNDFKIAEYFGGRYESAKTDGRGEFNRMLSYLKSKKGTISHILVYTTSRFSRTGGAAIKLAKDLRDKYGVQVLAVTQPSDTTTANGQFQQNIQLLFAEWDNEQRRQATSAGSKEKLEQGIWCLAPPMGYDAIRINGARTIVINKVGEHLRKAFRWKVAGMKNEEIVARLKALGVPSQLTDLQKPLDEIQQSIDNMEESYFIKRNMSDETYNKFRLKYAEEKNNIVATMSKCQMSSSNLEQYLEKWGISNPKDKYDIFCLCKPIGRFRGR